VVPATGVAVIGMMRSFPFRAEFGASVLRNFVSWAARLMHHHHRAAPEGDEGKPLVFECFSRAEPKVQLGVGPICMG
jgi:hypothetical protein